MRLSGLQNPQAAPTCSPGKHSATGEHSRVAADALPGLQNCPAYTFTAAIGTLSRRRRNAPVRATKSAGGAAGSPGKHSATGEHSRVAADALPGLQNCPGYTLTTTIGPVARTRRPWRRLRDAARYAASAPPEGKSGCLAGGNEYTRRAPWSGALSHNSA